MILPRRKFFSLMAAPLVVSAANIMPVKALKSRGWKYEFEYESRYGHGYRGSGLERPAVGELIHLDGAWWRVTHVVPA